MIKLLIVDDEYIVIESIKFIISKFLQNVEVVGSANSGREAFEKSIELKPDIVLMDIHIPKINGIEAIRQIRNSNPDVEFVIISAYEYFQYAKEAVNLGVHEYMTKPINKNKLISVIDNLAKNICLKREMLKKEMLLMERINTIVPHLEEQFIHSLLFTANQIEDLSFYEDVFGMNLKTGFALVAAIKDVGINSKADNINISLSTQKFYDLFSMNLKAICPCLIGPPLLDRVVAFVPMDEEINNYDVRNGAIDYANTLVKKISTNIKIPYSIGLGKVQRIENFLQSYKEALHAISERNSDVVTHFEDLHGTLPQSNNYPVHKEKIFLDKMVAGDLKGVLQAFEELFLWLIVNNQDNVNTIKSKLIELLIISQRAVSYDMVNTSLIDNDFLTRLLQIEEPLEIKLNYINYLKSLLTNIEENKNKNLNGIIKKALNYIEENYKRNITLDDVAKEISMSYHHFSKFFKESTGKNFVDYVTELKVEKAKAILKDKNSNIKEICYEVGYTDPNYFSKLFKKTTGMTPTEFRTYSISKG